MRLPLRHAAFGLASSLVLLAACSGGGTKTEVTATTTTRPGQPSAPDTSPIKIGEYGSLTGSTATFGQSTKYGIQLAIDEINAAGGVKGRKLQAIVEDDQGKPEEAASVVQKLINQDKVVAVLGEVASSRSLAAAPICQKAGIPMITPSSTNPQVTLQGDYIFRVCFIDPFQGEVMAKFAKDTLHAQRAAILKDVRNDYSVGLAQFFTQTFTANGGTIATEASYSEGDKDFKGQLTTIRAARPDVIFVPGYYNDIGLIAKQARELGIKQVLLGGDGWESPKLIEIGGDALEGAYYCNHYFSGAPIPRVQEFVAKYKAKYTDAPDSIAALAYDATKLLASAMTTAKSLKGSDLRDVLATTKDFPGVAGNITLDKDRNPIKPATILQVQHGQIAFVSEVGGAAPAPTAGTATPPTTMGEAAVSHGAPTTPSTTPATTPPSAASGPSSRSALAAQGPRRAPRPRADHVETFLQHAWNGLAIGSIYALIALGYTMVYGVLKFINFAHSEVFMMGAFAGFYVVKLVPSLGSGGVGGFVAVLLVAMAACATLGLLVERLAYRPLRNAPRLNSLITAIGVSLLLQNMGQIVFGAEPKRYPTLLKAHRFTLLAHGEGTGVSITLDSLVVLGVGIVLMLVLQWIVFRTKVGTAMRAVSENPSIAGLMGINTGAIVTFTFLMGASLAGAGGVLYGLTYPQIDPIMGTLPGLKAFVAAVLGGIGSVRGAMLGGLLIGLSEEAVVGLGGSTYRDAMAFGILIVILLVYPSGLFGRFEPEKV